MEGIDFKRLDTLIDLALEEDLDGRGDVTTLAVVPEDRRAEGKFISKQDFMVVAGLPAAERVFRRIDPALEFEYVRHDGDEVRRGETIAVVRGRARGILTGERTALNFLQRLCGVATMSRFYAGLAGGKMEILDTRKTTPGYRNLEKYAVKTGGASNHRIGLYDRVMIKDNHREMARLDGDDGVTLAVRKAREAFPDLEIEVEADSLEEVRLAADAGAEYILLDNMNDEMMAEAVKINAGRAKLEASGNITAERIPSIAELGVDYASSGALTHSVKSADISLEVKGL